MQQARGLLEISGPEGTVTRDTLTCCHCNTVVPLRAKPEDAGSTCLSCMRFQCRACAAKPCRPFEAWLETVEKPPSGLPRPGQPRRPVDLFRAQPLEQALPREQCRALRAVLIDRQSGRSCALLWDEEMATRVQAEMNRSAGGARYEHRVLTTPSDEQLRLMEAARFVVLNPMAQRVLALCWDFQVAQQLARLLNTTVQSAAQRALA